MTFVEKYAIIFIRSKNAVLWPGKRLVGMEVNHTLGDHLS